MVGKRRLRLGGGFIVAAMMACSNTLGPGDFYGVWKNDNARLTLSNTLARFESSCWAGDLAIPIQVSGNVLNAVGTIDAQGGAGIPDSRVVTVRGEKDGDRLKLRIEPQSLGLGPYTLSLNYPAQIPGCP
jgi:hypothetical protein